MKKLLNYIGTTYVYLVLVWVLFALSMDAFFIYLQLSNQHDRARKIGNEIMVRIDGTYSDNPKNIWYKEK